MTQQGQFTTPNAPISWGELIDKITILEIKQREIKNSQALKNIHHELLSLTEIATPILEEITLAAALSLLKQELGEINQKLWIVEDDLRLIEETKEFNDHFIQLARSVYQLNDHRAKIKKKINVLLSSEFVEEKSYKGFAP